MYWISLYNIYVRLRGMMFVYFVFAHNKSVHSVYVNQCGNYYPSKHGTLAQCSYNVTYDGRKLWSDVVTVYNMSEMSATQKCTLRTVAHQNRINPRAWSLGRHILLHIPTEIINSLVWPSFSGTYRVFISWREIVTVKRWSATCWHSIFHEYRPPHSKCRWGLFPEYIYTLGTGPASIKRQIPIN